MQILHRFVCVVGFVNLMSLRIRGGGIVLNRTYSYGHTAVWDLEYDYAKI